VHTGILPPALAKIKNGVEPHTLNTKAAGVLPVLFLAAKQIIIKGANNDNTSL
jgi:hypothetical protein